MTVVLYDGDAAAGGMMRTQIPKFRLPETVLDEEVNYILDLKPRIAAGPEDRLPEGAAGRRL